MPRHLRLVFESVIATLVALLLSLSGIPAVAVRDQIYLVTLQKSVQVQVDVLDWLGFLLLDIFSVFALWCSLAIKGITVSTRTLLKYSLTVFPIVFAGNALKVWAQILIAAGSGTIQSGLSPATLASMDAAGFAVMIGIAGLVSLGGYLLLSKSDASSAWPWAKTLSAPFPPD